MNKVKGSGITILRKILQKYKIDINNQLVPKLKPEAAEQIRRTIAVSWTDIPQEAKGSAIYETACLLFPGNEKHALERLGEVMAHETPWFYKMFFKIPTIKFVFSKIETLWSSFYDTGKASIENLNDHGVDFIIAEYAHYPEYMRQYMCGWLKGFMSLLSVNTKSVTHDSSNPNHWVWLIRW